MRITDMMRLTDSLTSQASAAQQVYQLTAEASSGLKIREPSDDPAGYASIASTTAQISLLQARSAAITNASGDLSLADGVLSSAGDVLVQAQQIAIEASDGTQSAADRANAATQVNQLVQQMIGLGNTQGSNGYLFGGTNTATPPFDAGGTFQGNGGTTQIEIADGVFATSNASGAQAFTSAGGSNVIADLQTLATALTNNNVATIQASTTTLSADNDQVTAARVSVDDSLDQLSSSGTIISNALTTQQTTLATESDADVTTVYSELSQAQTSYEAALSVNKQVMSMIQVALQQEV